MCGIFAYLGDKIDIKKIETAFMKTFKRGPDNNILKSTLKFLYEASHLWVFFYKHSLFY